MNKLCLFAVMAVFGVIAGCAPTYPKEKIIDSVKDICRKQYCLDVSAKVIGRTLGVYAQIENVFEAADVSAEATVEEILKSIRITDDATEKIENIMLSVSRVSLSTDAPIDFDVIIAKDKQLKGAQIIFTRRVEDIKRYLAADISRSDYFRRLKMEIDFDPQDEAKAAAVNYFKNRAMPTGIIKSKRISGHNALVFCEVFKNDGFKNEYLLLVNGYSLPPEIEEIISLHRPDYSGNMRRVYPVKYYPYGDAYDWQEDDFYFREVDLEEFRKISDSTLLK